MNLQVPRIVVGVAACVVAVVAALGMNWTAAAIALVAAAIAFTDRPRS